MKLLPIKEFGEQDNPAGNIYSDLYRFFDKVRRSEV